MCISFRLLARFFMTWRSKWHEQIEKTINMLIREQPFLQSGAAHLCTVFPVSLAKAPGESVGNATGTGSDAALPVPAWSNQISGGLCKNSSALSIDFRSISKRNSWIFVA